LIRATSIGVPRLPRDGRLTPYPDTRPTALSGIIMLTSGATLDDVKWYLGHSSISVTSDIYGHLVEGRSAEVAGGIERAIRAKR
jgi:integrase